jgi:hypothetical protein
MLKTVVFTFLNKQDFNRIMQILDEKGFTRADIFVLAFNNFRKILSKNENYTLRHQDMDRNKDVRFAIHLEFDIVDELAELGKKFGVTKHYIMREIVLEYLGN